jgi:AcrR family transcriptional regulator
MLAAVVPASGTRSPARRDGPRRRLDPDARRAEIIQAAAPVFAARPYDAITVVDIARAAGASRGLIIHYFSDKAGVFAAVAATFAARAAQAIRTDLDLPPAEKVAANIDACLAFAAEHRETVLALLPTGPSGQDSRLRQLTDGLRERVVDRMLVNHFGTTDVPELHRFSLRAYTGLFSVAVGDWLQSPTVSREETSRFLARALLHTVEDLRAY